MSDSENVAQAHDLRCEITAARATTDQFPSCQFKIQAVYVENCEGRGGWDTPKSSSSFALLHTPVSGVCACVSVATRSKVKSDVCSF